MSNHAAANASISDQDRWITRLIVSDIVNTWLSKTFHGPQPLSLSRLNRQSSESATESLNGTPSPNDVWNISAQNAMQHLESTIRSSKEHVPNYQKYIMASRRLADALDQRYSTSMGSLMSDALSLGENVSKETFDSVLREVSISGMNWGRIVAILTFTSALSCVSYQYPQSECHALDYVEWTIDFIETRLWTWIKENGGWNGFVSFESNRNEEDKLWNVASTAAKVAAGAMCVFAVMRYLSDRL